MRIGILTGGGDCPGLNAVIRAAVVCGSRSHGDEFVGFLDGWRGVLDGRSVPIDPRSCADLVGRGGTILGSSRTNPYAEEDGPARAVRTLESSGVEALVVIGGDDTLGVAVKLAGVGIRSVGVPKTIDNDLAGTEVTFGFHTAVQIVTDAIDRLHTTAESHHRVIVCEVMGRHAGWIATYAGIAGGATEILVPEIPFDIEAVCDRLRRRHQGGMFSSIVVVSEGAKPQDPRAAVAAGAASARAPLDAFGHERLGGIGEWVAEEIESRTGYESRTTILGHVQRGGTPTAYDRVLATRFGVAAIGAVHDGAFGSMVALQGGSIVVVPIADAVATPKMLDQTLLTEVAGPLLG